MELYQLKYFSRAAKYENISMAAQDLHVSQPSISKAVKALEKELQVELMRRNGKYCVLTHEGRLLQAKIIPILEELAEIPKEVQCRDSRTTIRINALSGALLIPEVIRKFREIHPDVFFTVMDQRENVSWDFCVRSTLPEVYFNNSSKLMTERLLVAFREDSLLSEKQNITLEDLKNETFVVLKSGGSMRTICDQKFKEFGFIPKQPFIVEDFYILKRMVQEGLGIAIWPQYSWRDRLNEETSCPDICFRTLDIPDFSRSLYLIRQKDLRMTPIMNEFSEFITKYFSNAK